jgi:hypothetical protein
MSEQYKNILPSQPLMTGPKESAHPLAAIGEIQQRAAAISMPAANLDAHQVPALRRFAPPAGMTAENVSAYG